MYQPEKKKEKLQSPFATWRNMVAATKSARENNCKHAASTTCTVPWCLWTLWQACRCDHAGNTQTKASVMPNVNAEGYGTIHASLIKYRRTKMYIPFQRWQLHSLPKFSVDAHIRVGKLMSLKNEQSLSRTAAQQHQFYHATLVARTAVTQQGLFRHLSLAFWWHCCRESCAADMPHWRWQSLSLEMHW